MGGESMVITNNGTTNRSYELEVDHPLKIQSKCIFPVGASTWEIGLIMPLVLFCKAFIDDVAAGIMTITYTADIPFLDNINSFMTANNHNRVFPIRYSIL